MKRLLLALAFVCAVTFSASAGDPHQPGVEPTPTPCPLGEVCGESATVPTAPPFIVIVANGEFIVIYLP